QCFKFFHSPGEVSKKRSCFSVRMFFPKSISYCIKQLLKTPVVCVGDKPLFFDVALHKENSCPRHVFDIHKTVYACAVPREFVIDCFKDPAAGSIPITVT